MNDDYSHIELTERGIALLNTDERLAALACFEKAYTKGSSPTLLSYLSYCRAMERGQIQESLKLCNEALTQEPANPVHYLNLGRIYLHAGNKDEALSSLRKGLSCGEEPTIRSLLERIGTRQKPVFPFLSRSNFLNRYIGLLLHRFKLR
jgi:tetratricopeptide (TPR) repeat protein